MVYELRRWFDDSDCLYTDDRRVKELALQSPSLRVIGSYFRDAADRRPFAWDIVGERDILAGIAHTFEAGASRRARAG